VRFAISGSWRHTTPGLKADLRAEVGALLEAGHELISGSALGVDYLATQMALEHDRRRPPVLVFIPTPLVIYVAHYRQRALERVIDFADADALIEQLLQLQARGRLREGLAPSCNRDSYYRRNSAVLAAADALLAFQVDDSAGTQDTIDKARALRMPVTVRSYTSSAAKARAASGR
jgi:hypothetical protein